MVTLSEQTGKQGTVYKQRSQIWVTSGTAIASIGRDNLTGSEV
jgi:hypothetical protein